MERKRIIQIVIIVVALCGIGMIGMGCMWNFNAEQRKADEAERQEQIQSNFHELVVFAQEYKESLEKISVASVEQMMEVTEVYDFDYALACETAGIGSEGDKIKEKVYLDASVIKRSIEWEKETPELCPKVEFNYELGRVGSTEMYLVYFYTDNPDEAFESSGLRSKYYEYIQIAERLYAVCFSLPNTCS